MIRGLCTRLVRPAPRGLRLLSSGGARMAGAPSAPAVLPTSIPYPRPTAPLDPAAFAAAFELVCCDALSAARANRAAERDEASQTMAEAAFRHASYVTARWFAVFADGAPVVSPAQFEANVLALLGGGEPRAALAFRALDADGDGVIGAAELRAYLVSFNALYLDGHDALHLDREAAANLASFCGRWTDSLHASLLPADSSAALDAAAWRAQPHGGQFLLVDSYVQHAGHCFGHMESKTDRVIDEIRSKQRTTDALRLGAGLLGMGAVASLFYL
jgi:hypothetical protein